MAWFCNHYWCECCGSEWNDEWSSMCDDDCPVCQARHMSPDFSDDLTKVVHRRAHSFIVLLSPEAAEDTPKYEPVAEFRTLELAEAYVHTGV
jgi:hypothetical protein